MENITPEVETAKSPLHTITPLSKYLAMGLFIALPFLGGWIGYTYAPEKIVEIEKITILEKETSPEESLEEIRKNYFPALNNLNVGDSIGAFKIKSVELDTFTPFFGGPNGEPYTLPEGRHTALVTMGGTVSLSGKLVIENSLTEEGKAAGTAYLIAFKPTPSEVEKLPFIEGFNNKDKFETIFVEGIENHPFVLDTLTTLGCSIQTDEWCKGLEYIESDEMAITITGFNLYKQNWPSGVPYFPVTTLVQ